MNMRALTKQLTRGVLVLPPLTLLASAMAHASSINVSTTAQLNNALLQSQSAPSNVPLTIKLAKGLYGLGPFNQYDRIVASAQLTLEGGYDATFATRQIDPGNTVIDLGGTRGFDLRDFGALPSPSLVVDGITFQDGSRVSLFAGDENNNTAGYVTVRNARFTNLTEGVGFQPVNGSFSIVNALFDHLQTSGPQCEVDLFLSANASANLDFVSADTSGGKSFCIDSDPNGATNYVSIYNSIFWPSDNIYGVGNPVSFISPGPDAVPPTVSLFYNTIRNFTATGATVTEVGTLSANPQDNPAWADPANGGYTLLPTSSSINSGTFIGNFLGGPNDIPNTDIQSSPRVAGGNPDRGAFESPYANVQSTVVTNTNDSGPGSLRAAIITANVGADSNTIVFDLPSCPSIIKLQTALPTIHNPLVIDGYAGNALATRNTDLNAFNANLCVIIEEATPESIISAFTVDTSSAGLSLTGVAFGGFYEPVAVLGGSDNIVAGNQFGGVVGGIPLPGANNNAIFVSGIDSGNITIGGATPGDRNVIAGATHDGIVMDTTVTTQNCHIDNNLIGLGADGVSEVGNGYGVELQNSSCEISANRIAANTLGGIWINGGQSNSIQRNSFGINTQGNSTQSYGWAVRVNGHENVIGAPRGAGFGTAQGFGNFISFMELGGVLIDGGFDNTVRSNLSDFNGPAHNGSSPDISLNGAQVIVSAPTISGVALPNGLPVGANEPGTVTAHLNTYPSLDYQVDVYYSPTCDSTGRGHSDYYLGSQLVKTDAQGQATFSVPVMLPVSAITSAVSLTATDVLMGNSSEMGMCAGVDTIFKNGVER